MADGVAIVPMTVAHAARVLEIYGEGIATGDATLESVVPDWETFDAGPRPGARRGVPNPRHGPGPPRSGHPGFRGGRFLDTPRRHRGREHRLARPPRAGRL